MPLFAVLLEDSLDGAPEIRRRHMGAHLDFLDRNAAAILAAGPLHQIAPAAAAPAGGLWLVEATDSAAVEALVREDPFWSAGLRRAVRLVEWRQVFADGRRIRPAPELVPVTDGRASG
jgi:uncharacterized protein YciI